MRFLLARLLGWFGIVNTVLLLVVLSNYFTYLPHFSTIPYVSTKGIITAVVFMMIGMVGQSAVFSFLALLPVLIVGFIFPRRWLVCPLAILFSSVMAFLLVTDDIVFHLYHYHLAGVVWKILLSGAGDDVLELSWIEYSIAAGLFVGFLLIETLLFVLVDKFIIQQERVKKLGRWILLILGACLFLSYTLVLETLVLVHANRAHDMTLLANVHNIVLEERAIPYYNQLLGALVPKKHFAIALETRDSGFFVQNKQMDKRLNYPLHPLESKKPEKPYNIVFILLDAWRFDRLNAVDSPHLYEFSQNAWVFKQHYSGGNSTRTGIFSLFYSIPSSYWTAVINQQRGPVFIHTLLQDRYQMGIFRSASLHFPALDQSVFVEMKSLRIKTPGKESFNRDRRITQDAIAFLKNRDKNKPFFSFIFYDESHNYCDPSIDYPKPFQPAVKVCNRILLNKHSDPIPYLNRYRNAIHFDDDLAGQILAELKNQGLLKNTIVVITADHGEEFNESHRNYWGHTSNYTPWQTHVPMVVYWPEKTHREFRYLTTHYDIIPLLMQQALNVKNSFMDYSVGESLLTQRGRPFFLVNSYIDYAIMQPELNRVTRIYPDGNYAVLDLNGNPVRDAKLDLTIFEAAWRQMNRYFWNH